MGWDRALHLSEAAREGHVREAIVEVRYELVQVKQQKYVCRCGGCIETALGPERATPGSRYSLAFAIKVCLDKWLDHIPLERQCRILDRRGLVVTSQTLWDLATSSPAGSRSWMPRWPHMSSSSP